MTKIAGKANVGSMAIEEAWSILTAEPDEVRPEQRTLRRNLARRFVDRRLPFSQQALDELFRPSVEALLRSTLKGSNQ